MKIFTLSCNNFCKRLNPVLSYSKSSIFKYNKTCLKRFSNFNSYKKPFDFFRRIENSDSKELFDISKELIQNEENLNDYELWTEILNKYNNLLCDKKLTSSDTLSLLQIIKYVKLNSLKEVSSSNNNNNNSNKLYENFNKINQPKFNDNFKNDFAVSLFSFLKSNLSLNVVKELLKEKHNNNIDNSNSNSQEEEEELEELIQAYELIIENLEKKILNDFELNKHYLNSAIILILESFSGYGTNRLYESLLSQIIKNNNNNNKLSFKEILKFLEFFPKDIYMNKVKNKEFNQIDHFDYLELKEESKFKENFESFKEDILKEISKNIKILNENEFLDLWDLILKYENYDKEIISNFLNSFDFRISKNQITKEFYLKFLETLAYFTKNADCSSINFDLIYQSIHFSFIKKYLNSFNMKEIATLFWMFYNFKILNSEKIKQFESVIEEYLLSFINEHNTTFKNGLENTNFVNIHDKYQLEIYDLKAILFFMKDVNYKNASLKENILSVVKMIETAEKEEK